MEKNIDNIYPGFANVEYNGVDVDGLHTVSLIITNYPEKIEFLAIMDAVPKSLENRCSIYIFKQDETLILKELTNVIASASSEKKTISKNQLDVDILESITDKAKELRRKIQIENEGVYRVCVYISVWDNRKETALEKARLIQNMLYVKGVVSKIGNFRQKELYIANLPMNTVDNYLKKNTYVTFTTTTLSYFFPYYNKYIIENNGIQFGITDKNICIIDMFSKNSTNANMLIVGSSGSGKSYFAHILVIRGAISGIKQRVIDPEGEYVCLAKMLGGKVIKEDFNLMYFSENYIKNNKNVYIENKINSILEILNCKKIFLDSEEEALKLAMRTSYEINKILEAEDSLYIRKDENGVFVNRKYIDYMKFPNLDDVLKKISDVKLKNTIFKKIRQVISDTTIRSREIIKNADIIVYNLKEIQENKREVYIKIYLENIKSEYGTKLQIYIDELWKCIGYGKSDKVIYEITEMFKSIRKQNAGIIVITQDISDLVKYENGAFAKSILNNSYLKAYFKMEYADVEILARIGLSERRELEKIKKLNKGKAIITRGLVNFCLDVVADENEKKYIENGEKNGENIGCNG